jgi:hypothetical protein
MTSLLNADRPTVIDYILSDSSLFDKYRGLYYIRNSKDGKLVLEMTKLLHNDSLGALLKHEVPHKYDFLDLLHFGADWYRMPTGGGT